MKNDTVTLFGVIAHRLSLEELDEYGYLSDAIVYGNIGERFSVFALTDARGWEVSMITKAEFGKGFFIDECSLLCETLEEAQQDLLARVEQKMKMYQTAYNVLCIHKV